MPTPTALVILRVSSFISRSFGFLAIALLAAGPARAGETLPSDAEVLNLLNEYCAGCHSGPTAKAGVFLDSIAGAKIASGRAHKEVVTDGMPPETAHNQPSPTERATIDAWLAHFAPPPPSDAAALTLLRSYCADCHSGIHPRGDVALDNLASARAAADKAETALLARKMPTSHAPAQPRESERDALIAWFVAAQIPADTGGAAHP